MTFATRLTKVRYRSEHFDERTGMCYHQAPPSERVVVHVRDAGQAKPHLEHNPLSLLGACYATPRRKLNGPGQDHPVIAECPRDPQRAAGGPKVSRGAARHPRGVAPLEPDPHLAPAPALFGHGGGLTP